MKKNTSDTIGRTILLRINGQVFILETGTELTADNKDYIEALCRYAYDDASEFSEALADEHPGESLSDLSSFEMAGLFQRVLREQVGIDATFKSIDLEVSISQSF